VSAERLAPGDEPVPGAAVFASGMRWKLTTQVVTQVTRLGVAVLLARLMSPFEFGLAGLALVFAPLAYVFTDLGAALVQQRRQTEDDRSTAFWMSIAIGIVLTLIGLAVAGPIARFYGEPEVEELFMVLSASFLLTAAATTHNALLHRAMAFRRIELANMVAALGGAAVAVTVALLGGGAWAIILQLVANSLLVLILFWALSPWRPTRRFSRQSLRGLSAFTAHNTGSNLLHYLEGNTDNLLIGRVLGPASLGVYSIAYNLMLYPVTRFAVPIHQVMFPLLARIQDDDARVCRMWLRVTRVVAAIVAPMMIGLIVVAPEFVDVLLGEKWADATPIVQILAVAGLVYAVRVPCTSVLLAKGRARALFRFGLASATLLITGFFVTVSWGVNAVAAAFTASFLVMTPVLVTLAARSLGVPTRQYVRNLRGAAIATMAMALVTLAIRQLLVHLDVAPIAVLAAVVAVGASVYVPLCLWLVPDLRAELDRMWAKLRARRNGGYSEHGDGG
jgi:O-antigen/teichoic acid export membrane protein